MKIQLPLGTRDASARNCSFQGGFPTSFLLAYACLLTASLARPALWLDEVLQLAGVRDRTLDEALRYATTHAGGVPLGYVFTLASVHMFGYSVFTGRLPSLLFSLAACAGVAVLARSLGTSRTWLAVAFFALMPLQFRYAIEARPYGPALCISVWSTVAFLWFIRRPNTVRWLVYLASVVVGLYTQPYVIFVPCAHLAWVWSEKTLQRQVGVKTAFSIGVAVLAFLPWYFYALSNWRAALVDSNVRAHFGLGEVEVIVKELTGAGYFGTVLIGGLAIGGLKELAPSHRRLLILYVLAPILGAVAANILFGYFMAIRQMIFVLAPLALLAALGLARALRQRPRLAAIAGTAILIACLYEDASFVLEPREDWQSASAQLVEESQNGQCVILSPESSDLVFGFFEPSIPEHLCAEGVTGTRSIVVGVSPYDPDAEYQSLKARLDAEGWYQVSEESFHGPRIESYACCRP